MTPEYRRTTDIFFSLLRSGLYGVPIPEGEMPSEIDWHAVGELAKMHSVTGIIIESVQFLPARLHPSAEIKGRMNAYALRLIQSNMGLDKRVAQLVSFFEEHGIKGVLLKGQGIARTYRVPQMRNTGDIDFYVGQEQYPRAVELCRRHLIKDNEYGKESHQHFPFRMEGVTVELHRIATEIYVPFNKSKFQRWIVEELEHSPRRRLLPMANGSATVPSLEFDAIYIYYHAMHHFVVGGIGLRQLCDWTMLFHSHAHELDFSSLEAKIKRFGLTRGWKMFAFIAVEYLGLSPEKMPLYDAGFKPQSERLLEAILTGGNFGWYAKVNASDPATEYNVKYALAKFGYMFRYFRYSFPIMPLDATCFYLYRMFVATRSGCRITLGRLLGRRP